MLLTNQIWRTSLSFLWSLGLQSVDYDSIGGGRVMMMMMMMIMIDYVDGGIMIVVVVKKILLLMMDVMVVIMRSCVDCFGDSDGSNGDTVGVDDSCGDNDGNDGADANYGCVTDKV